MLFLNDLFNKTPSKKAVKSSFIPMSSRRKSTLAKLQNISFAYDRKKILKNIQLEIKERSFNCIVGKSGIGKSTMLYILAGLLKPDQGDYIFKDEFIYSKNKIGLGKFRKENIGLLFQDFRLIPFLNVKQNIEFPILFSGNYFHREMTKKIMQYLKIEELKKAYPKEISGGEAQRVAIARAMILEPKLLLLDEPTGNLDVQTEKKILQMIIDLKKKGLSIFCATHSLNIMKKADKIWELKNGSILELSKKELKQ